MVDGLPSPEGIIFDLDGVLADLHRGTALVSSQALATIAEHRPIAVVTTCPRRLAESVLARHGFLPYVTAVVGREDGPCKPSPAPVVLAMERMAVASAWMLGDNPSDVEAARKAGVVALAVVPRGIGAESHAERLRAAGAMQLVDGVGGLVELLARVHRVQHATQHEALQIRLDDLSGPEVATLLQEHRDFAAKESPEQSIHALNLEALRAPDITFWSVWQGLDLAGCGALKQLDETHGELKSMRTAESHRRRGVAMALLEHIVSTARQRDYQRLSLETGAQAAFEPARALYARFGFEECGPFGDYTDDTNSFFMTMKLAK